MIKGDYAIVVMQLNISVIFLLFIPESCFMVMNLIILVKHV